MGIPFYIPWMLQRRPEHVQRASCTPFAHLGLEIIRHIGMVAIGQTGLRVEKTPQEALPVFHKHVPVCQLLIQAVLEPLARTPLRGFTKSADRSLANREIIIEKSLQKKPWGV